MSSFPFFSKRISDSSQDSQTNLFLSHNSKDKKYGDILRELLIGIGLRNDKLIYTSNENNGVPFGKNIYNYLQERLNDKTIVLFLLSSEYFSSVVCLNELGATWVKKHEYYNFYIPGFNLKDNNFLNSCIDNNSIGIFLNGDSQCRVGLKRFIDSIIHNFELNCDDYRLNKELDEACRKFRNISVLKKAFTTKIVEVDQKRNYTFCRLDALLPTEEDFHEGESHWLQLSREYNKDIIEKVEKGKSITFVPNKITNFYEEAYGEKNFRNIYADLDGIKIF